MKRTMLALRLILAALIFSIAFPAMALDVPKRSPRDPRIQRIAYHAEDVVQLDVGTGYATHILLEPGEQVVDINSGFSDGYEFADRANNFYLKPKSVKDTKGVITQPTAAIWNTNLSLVTNRRSYSFMLKLHETPRPEMAFRLVFEYPETYAAEAKAKTEKRSTQAKLDVRAAPRNWNYTMQVGADSSEIAPNMAYDDGRHTYLRFPGNRDFPSIFSVSEDGSESMINTHVDPQMSDVLVVHRVGKQFYLRLAKQVVGIYNESYDSHGLPPQNGTTVPGVQRRIKGDVSRAHDADSLFFPASAVQQPFQAPIKVEANPLGDMP